jgi:hypothetical protein
MDAWRLRMYKGTDLNVGMMAISTNAHRMVSRCNHVQSRKRMPNGLSHNGKRNLRRLKSTDFDN